MQQKQTPINIVSVDGDLASQRKSLGLTRTCSRLEGFENDGEALEAHLAPLERPLLKTNLLCQPRDLTCLRFSKYITLHATKQSSHMRNWSWYTFIHVHFDR